MASVRQISGPTSVEADAPVVEVTTDEVIRRKIDDLTKPQQNTKQTVRYSSLSSLASARTVQSPVAVPPSSLLSEKQWAIVLCRGPQAPREEECDDRAITVRVQPGARIVIKLTRIRADATCRKWLRCEFVWHLRRSVWRCYTIAFDPLSHSATLSHSTHYRMLERWNIAVREMGVAL